MAQINLYYKTQLETKVSLLPEQINGNIDDNILNNLRVKVEGKIDENGIVIKINRLIDYTYGMIDKTNFMGTTVYTVKYECLLCSPIKSLEIIGVVDNIVKGYIIGRNGPVIIVVEFNNINPQIFEISNNTIVDLQTKKPIEKGNYIKVSIININNNLGEKNIVVMCKLLSFASEDEITHFHEEQQLISGGHDTNQEFI